MRNVFVLAIVLPALVLAAGRADFTRVQTIANPEAAQPTGDVRATVNWPAVTTDIAGRLDTVGGTTYEWQFNGPGLVNTFSSEGIGLHTCWMFSADQGGTYPDRNMRYNFLDYASGQWAFNVGASFMDFGVNAFSVRTGFGHLEVSPNDNCAYISAHQAPSGTYAPVVGKDAAPGTGVFEACVGTDNFLWPAIGITRSGTVHAGIIQDPSRTDLYYSQINPWCTWSSPVEFASPAPQPAFSDQAVAASHDSSLVCIFWVVNTDPAPAYYRISEDDGATWTDPTEFLAPPAFTPGSETTASFNISSVYPFYAAGGRLHVAASVMPYVGGSGYTIPAEIWHWTTEQGWNLVHRYPYPDTLNLRGPVGYNAIFATRPSLCEAPDGDLICVWEQFDTMNFEPSTGYSRADIFAARSLDNGVSWGEAVRLTDVDSTSKRFPVVSTRTHGDTCYVTYVIDQIAGMSLYSQGPITQNPIIVQRFDKAILPPPNAVAERPAGTPRPLTLEAGANPFREAASVSFSLPVRADVKLSIYDVTGKLVALLADGNYAAGRHALTWKADGIKPGIYVCRLASGRTVLSRKLTLL
jgi:hypothetical protein